MQRLPDQPLVAQCLRLPQRILGDADRIVHAAHPLQRLDEQRADAHHVCDASDPIGDGQEFAALALHLAHADALPQSRLETTLMHG